MRIAVLGGGNGSHAAAADLSEQGHDVRFWRRDGSALDAVRAAGGVILRDFHGERLVPIPSVTADLGAAVRGAELIVSPSPAFAQADIARALAPHLADGQVIFLPPGTFGAYVMTKVLRDAGSTARVAIAETGTLPYLARMHGPARIAITVRAKRLPTGVFPARDSDRAIAIVREAYPSVEPIEDALSGALMNAGPIIHPPLILMNAGPLDLFAHPEGGGFTRRVPQPILALGRWDIHNEGTQAAIRRVTDALDDERIAVREALGYRPYHFPLRDHYTSDRWMYGDAHDRLVDSGDWRESIDLERHRYMREDIEYGLAFLVSVGRWAGVPAPVATGLLAIGGAVCGTDFTRGPRTLDALGLSSFDRAGMAALLSGGL